MLKRVLLAILLVFGACFGQEQSADQGKSYKLDFVIKELSGGKVTNSRSYMMVARGQHGNQMLRTGDKVPVPTGASSAGTSWTYIDVGVNIDVIDLVRDGNDLRMHVTADITSAEKDSATPQPIIRQNRWGSDVIVPIRKPTTLFSSDSTSSKSQTQVEVTATPIP